MGFLYRLDFASGKSYIGITKKPVLRRFNAHKPKHDQVQHSLVGRAWNKYGEPKLRVLAIVENRMLFRTERAAIKVYKTLCPKGYNLSVGGSGNRRSLYGKHHTPNLDAQILGARGGKASAANLTAEQRSARSKYGGESTKRLFQKRRKDINL